MEQWGNEFYDTLLPHLNEKGAMATFARRLEKEWLQMGCFLYTHGVEPTNNRAERALRFAVL